MMGGGYPARRRTRLWVEQGGLCYFCEGLTRLPEDVPGFRDGLSTPDMATLDHVYPRGSPMRALGKGRDRIVMACWACNNRRGIEHDRNLRARGARV
jgi:hypothetical protein